MLQNFLKFPLKKKKRFWAVPEFPDVFLLWADPWVVSAVHKAAFPMKSSRAKKTKASPHLWVWTPAGPPLSPLPTLHWPSQEGEGSSNSWSCLCSQALRGHTSGQLPRTPASSAFLHSGDMNALSLRRPLGKCLTTSWKMTPCKGLHQVQEEKERSLVSFLS